MNEYEAYVLFLALKRHFTDPSYSFHRFNGKVRTSVQAYERRNDRFFFKKLSTHENPKGFLIAQFVELNPQKVYISSIVRDPEAIRRYQNWKKIQESLEYTFKVEINPLRQSDFVVDSFGHNPKVLEFFYDQRISRETLCILERELHVFRSWSKNIRDTLIFPDTKMMVEKYAGFLLYDIPKVRKIIKEHFSTD